MSINKAHSQDQKGIVLFFGERLLIFYDGCDLKLESTSFSGKYHGRIYLTSHRVVFISNTPKNRLLSLSMPFVQMHEIDIKQPVFGANRIEGKVRFEPNEQIQGESPFSLTFKKGGAIEFGEAVIELGKRACDSRNRFVPPPPYTPTDNDAGQYYASMPPTYVPPYNDPYYGFMQTHEAFTVPPTNTLHHVAAPPPYPGAGPIFSSTMPEVAPNNSTSHAVISPNQQTCSVSGGYYFPGDPHAVYAYSSAPPEESHESNVPPANNSNNVQPPPYPDNYYPINKKDQ